MNKSDARVWDRTWSSSGKITFDLHTRLIFKNMSKEISFDGKKVLELGCGSGRLSYLANLAGASQVTLVDFSDVALRTARNLFSGISNVSFIKANLLELNLSQKYDIVFSSGVVEHFKDEELLLSVKAHAEHSGESVVIVVPSDTVFNARRSVSTKNIELYGYQKPISAEQMERLFEGAHVTIKAIRRFHTMYGVPILSRTCGRKLGKLGRLCAFALKPLDSSRGGLLLAVGTV